MSFIPRLDFTFKANLQILLCMFFFGGAAGTALAQTQPIAGKSEVIFSTSFEPSEGYDPQFTLIGQEGWVGFGSGGNGLLTNFFAGYGQQAFIGFNPPDKNDDTFNLWRPVDLAPIKTNQSLITFSVLMQVVDSNNGNFDDFRWSAYNTNGDRLFTLDFDNAALVVSYGLNNTNGFVSTGFGFDNDGIYELEVKLNFARNLWTASLNSTVIVNAQPITTTAVALNLGDFDAVWAIRHAAVPGDNYMIFDNFRIVAEDKPSIPSTVESIGVLTNGHFGLRVLGEPGLKYAIESSTNLNQWQVLKVMTAPAGGIFVFEDAEVPRPRQRFYRVSHRP